MLALGTLAILKLAVDWIIIVSDYFANKYHALETGIKIIAVELKEFYLFVRIFYHSSIQQMSVISGSLNREERFPLKSLPV